MKQQHVPPGYSRIMSATLPGGPRVQFVVKSAVEGHTVRALTSQAGVGVKVDECNFHAIVEFPTHLFKTGFYNPKKWHVGFVQNMMGGSGIAYTYGALTGNPTTLAMVGPRVVPCKDAGGPTTWYDPNVGLSLKQFGVADDAGVLMLPNGFPNPHPARTDVMTRYVEMGDAPGSGVPPIRLPCAQRDPGNRAQLATEYTLGLTDPLDTVSEIGNRAPLRRISGVLRFKTWLAMSSEANLQNLRTTTQFAYLYSWTWEVTYTTTVDGQNAQSIGTASLVDEGACGLRDDSVILNGDDANESASVKFL